MLSKKIIEDTIVDVNLVVYPGETKASIIPMKKPKGSELSAKTDEHKLYFHKRRKRIR
jgi:prolyl oligopeptidase